MSQPFDDPARPGTPAGGSSAPFAAESQSLESETESRVGLSKVLVAVDLSDRSDRIIREALRIAASARAEIILVHVVCDLENLLGAYVVKKPLPQLQDDLEIEGKARLRRLGQEYLDNGKQSRELVLTGVPWSEIVGAATRHRADLIVIGAHTEDGPDHRILGSTAGRVLRNSPCSVLVVPAE
jgi:universal stress protein A